MRRPLQILVVDDDRDTANSLAMLLKFRDQRAEAVYSAAAVLRAIWFAEVMLLHPRLLCLPEAFL